MITNNAKGLISILAYEAILADARVSGGNIEQSQAAGCIYERLQAKAKDNVNLKTFLRTFGHVPKDEDKGKDYPWAEDKREKASHFVTRKTGESVGLGPGGGAKFEDDERGFPVPGGRGC